MPSFYLEMKKKVIGRVSRINLMVRQNWNAAFETQNMIDNVSIAQ